VNEQISQCWNLIFACAASPLWLSLSFKRTAGEKGSAFSESIEFRECPRWEGERT
jgi:hypothetical protein